MDLLIRIVGEAGIAGTVLIVGLLLYDKNPMFSGVVTAIGLIIAITAVISEIYLRNKELNARIHNPSFRFKSDRTAARALRKQFLER